MAKERSETSSSRQEILLPEGPLFTFRSNETDPRVVQAEVEALVGEAAKRGEDLMDVFNNFLLHFASQSDSIGSSRQMIQSFLPEKWTKPSRELGEDEGKSKHFLDTTPEQFYADVDRAAAACGLDPERDIWEVQKVQGAPAVYSNEKVVEVYTRLRTQGYNHYKDLTA